MHKKWIFDVSERYSEILDIENKKYIAQIILSSEQDFRPYRYIEFYVLDTDETQEFPVFVYQDKDGDPVSDIIENLSREIGFIVS